LLHLERWLKTIRGRPAVERGIAVPERLDLGKTSEEFVTGAQKMLA
jgi:GST-like protein